MGMSLKAKRKTPVESKEKRKKEKHLFFAR